MSNTLPELIPDPDTLVDLEPDELGRAVLEDLKTRDRNGRDPYSFVQFLFQGGDPAYLSVWRDRILRAVMEAWAWLERAGLIAEDIGPTGPRTFFVTKRGYELKTEADFEAFRQASNLPKDLIHLAITKKAWSNFLRGDFGTAVFQAFKEVEERVRGAGGFGNKSYGEKLMRAAFDKDKGPLTDPELPDGERVGLQNLFAGAIGAYKNAHSHRTVAINDPIEAYEMLLLASHLLRIVDARAPSR